MITPVVQRWSGGRAVYRPAGEVIDTRAYEVAEIHDDATAKEYVCRNHYSASYPAARRRFGLYRRGQLVGVAVYSVPCNEKVITLAFPGTEANDSVELGRFVLDDDVPANGETWFFAQTRRMLRGDYLGIVSFSDDQPRTDEAGNVIFVGHVGTIYAASNGVYVGRGTGRRLKLLPDGTVMSDRAISKISAGARGWRYACAKLEAFGATPAPEGHEGRAAWLAHWLKALTRIKAHPGNHKYLWALDRSYRLPSTLPYPKMTAIQLQPVLFN